MNTPAYHTNQGTPAFCIGKIGHRLVYFTMSLVLATLLHAADAGGAIGIARESGILRGTVVNEATGVYLEGAEVALDPEGGSTLTTRDGRFSFSNLPAGDYTLKVSYIGLDTKTLRASVRAGAVTVEDVSLTAKVYELSRFVVEGEREGNSLAIIQQRNAPNIKNVLSSDAFGTAVADLNVGNFLQRIPGVGAELSGGEIIRIQIRGAGADLNSISTDGTRIANGTSRTFSRGMDIDRISADFIESIEVIKAMTPDQDADSIGGSVNLKTKSALDRKGRRMTYNVGYNYNPTQKTYRPLASASYSNIFKEGKLGILFTASYNETHRPRDEKFFHWEGLLDTSRPAWFNANGFGQDQLRFQRGGAGFRVDYKLSETARVYFNTDFSNYEDQINRRWARLNSPAAASLVSVTSDTTTTRNQTFRFHHTVIDREVLTATARVGGEGKPWGGELDFNLSYSWSDGATDQITADRTIAGTGFQQVRTGDNLSLTQVSGPDIYDWSNSVLGAFAMDKVDSGDRIAGAQINFRKRMPVELPFFLKVGARFRDQERKRDHTSNPNSYVGANGVAGPVGASNDDNLQRFHDSGYVHKPNKDDVISFAGITPVYMHIEEIRNEYNRSPQLFRQDVLVQTRDSIRSDNVASEAVTAAYLMGDLSFGRLSIVGGIRVEETRVEGRGFKQEITPEERARRAAWVGTVTPEETIRRAIAEFGNKAEGNARYSDLFPSLHFKYQFTKNLIARASYSTGIGRPNFTQIVPVITVNHDNLTLTANNPGLKPLYSDNYDVALEYYFRPAGLASIGAFEKRLSNFIYRQNLGALGSGNDFGDAFAGYTLMSDVNGGTARIRGLEVSFQQQFTNLPGFWQGFGAFANFTWLETEGEYLTPGVVAKNEVPNFKPKTGNVGVSYIAHGWTARVLANYTGDFLLSYNANAALRQYTKSAMPVDLSLTYAFNPRLRVYFDVINVFNVGRQDTYVYVPDRPIISLAYTPTLKFGISGSF